LVPLRAHRSDVPATRARRGSDTPRTASTIGEKKVADGASQQTRFGRNAQSCAAMPETNPAARGGRIGVPRDARRRRW
jgi:hypothetical protein